MNQAKMSNDILAFFSNQFLMHNTTKKKNFVSLKPNEFLSLSDFKNSR